MGRNDGILYSGQTSASRKAEKELKKQIEKAENRRKLAPSADVVLDMLEKERTSLQKKLLSYITTETPEEYLKAVVMSLKLYDEYLASLETRLSNILRLKENTKEME